MLKSVTSSKHGTHASSLLLRGLARCAGQECLCTCSIAPWTGVRASCRSNGMLGERVSLLLMPWGV